MLFGYNRSVAIYHCPADRSLTDAPAPRLRNRSYNMSQSVNGYPEFLERYGYPGPLIGYKRLSAIRVPGVANLFVFIDEHPDTLYDPCFSNPVDMPDTFVGPHWWDMPADRHSQGAVLSFADSHAERWRWRAPMTFPGIFKPPKPQQLPDYFRIQSAMKMVRDP